MLFPEPWLSVNPSLHALRRLAILADAGAVRLLLSLSGEDRTKEQRIQDAAADDKVAARAIVAAQAARVHIAAHQCEGSAPGPTAMVRASSSSAFSDATDASSV